MSSNGRNGAFRDGRPLLLLVSSGDRTYREYVLQSVTSRYRLWLLQPEPVTWEVPYISGHTSVDTYDRAQAVDAARQVAAEEEVRGVLCYHEGLVLTAAYMAEALGLPGMSPASVNACRDKRATRVALALAGVPQATSVTVSTLHEARRAAEAIGYPVVVKPRGLAASIGVLRVDDASALADAYTAAREGFFPGVPVYDAGVLVEEYLDGEEISVDSVLFEGSCMPMVLARKRVGFDPFFEETGHVVDGSDPLLGDPGLRHVLADCHAALGVEHGITHTEIRLTSRGPRVVEVNARLGGDLIPYVGWLATGIDAAAAAADVAAGRSPRVEATCSRVAAVRFLYPEGDCEVSSVDVSPLPPDSGIERVAVTAKPGAQLRLPPRGYLGRYAAVITVGDKLAKCERGLDQAAALIRLEARPLEPALTS